MRPGSDIATRTVFTAACRTGDFDVFFQHVDPVTVNEPDDAGVTAVMAAADGRQIVILETLLTMPGVDLSARDRDGNTAIHYAASKSGADDVGTIRLLVRTLTSLVQGRLGGVSELGPVNVQLAYLGVAPVSLSARPPRSTLVVLVCWMLGTRMERPSCTSRPGTAL